MFSPYARLVEPRLEQIRAMLEKEIIASALTGSLRFLASDFLMRLWHKYFVHKTGSCITPDAFAKNLQKSLELDVSVFVTAFLSMVQTGDAIGSRLGEVPVPMKMILGDKDFFTGAEQTRVVIASLAPGAEVVILPDTTHWANSERPKRVNHELGGFFHSVF